MTTKPSPSAHMSLQEAAHYWGVSEALIRTLVAEQHVDVFRPRGRGAGGSIRLRRRDVESLFVCWPTGGAS